MSWNHVELLLVCVNSVWRNKFGCMGLSWCYGTLPFKFRPYFVLQLSVPSIKFSPFFHLDFLVMHIWRLGLSIASSRTEMIISAVNHPLNYQDNRYWIFFVLFSECSLVQHSDWGFLWFHPSESDSQKRLVLLWFVALLLTSFVVWSYLEHVPRSVSPLNSTDFIRGHLYLIYLTHLAQVSFFEVLLPSQLCPFSHLF